MSGTIKLGEFRKLTNGLGGDDFEIKLSIVEKLDDKDLEKMRYPYPYSEVEHSGLEFVDIGHSDKIIKLSTEIKKEL